MLRLILCLLCGLRYDVNEHRRCPSCDSAVQPMKQVA